MYGLLWGFMSGWSLAEADHLVRYTEVSEPFFLVGSTVQIQEPASEKTKSSQTSANYVMVSVYLELQEVSENRERSSPQEPKALS